MSHLNHGDGGGGGGDDDALLHIPAGILHTQAGHNPPALDNIAVVAAAGILGEVDTLPVGILPVGIHHHHTRTLHTHHGPAHPTASFPHSYTVQRTLPESVHTPNHPHRHIVVRRDHVLVAQPSS